MREMREEAVPHLEQINLGPLDAWLMKELHENHYPSGVAKNMQLPAPTVSQMLKRLEKEGFVTRSTESSDLRRFRFSITSEGLNALRQSQQVMVSTFEKKLERIADKDREQFAKLLETLTTSQEF